MDTVTNDIPFKIHNQNESHKQERIGADTCSKDAEQVNFTYDRIKTVTGRSVPSCCQRIFVITSVLVDLFIPRQVMHVKHRSNAHAIARFLWTFCERDDCVYNK